MSKGVRRKCVGITDEVVREKGEREGKKKERGRNVLEFGGSDRKEKKKEGKKRKGVRGRRKKGGKRKKRKKYGTCVEEKKRGEKKEKRRRRKCYHNIFTINFNIGEKKNNFFRKRKK